VIPGDQLVLKVKLLKKSRIIWKFSCEATVDGELVTSADMLCAATEKE
jgi:3-hydroxyacyl-[acyl-carrier-protein] dehydratase